MAVMELDRLSVYTAEQTKNIRADCFVRLISSLSHNFNQYPRRLSDEQDLKKAFEYHADFWPDSPGADLITKGMDRLLRTKAGVTAGTTTEPSWAAALAAVRPLTEAFV